MWYVIEKGVEKGCPGIQTQQGIKEKVGVDMLKSGVLFLKGFEEVWLGPRKASLVTVRMMLSISWGQRRSSKLS